ncbi:MAG: hypothetical protein ABIQ40_07300 [Bacteroidia bacterium]
MKKSILKGICFCVMLPGVLALADVIYVRWFYQTDVVEADATLLFKLDSLQNKCDVLYFGESSNATYSPDDTCALSISQLIQRQCPQVKIGTLDHGAYHAANYLALIKNIRLGAKVKTLVVTMNLRSFGIGWINSALETPLMKANVMYSTYPPIIKRLMLAFGDYDTKPQKEREKEMVNHWRKDPLNVAPDFEFQTTYDWNDARCYSTMDTFPDGTPNNPQKDLACNYIKVLGFSIDTLSNPRIKDFDEIVQSARKKNLRLVFNLVSEKVDCADSLVGSQLVSVMMQNRDLLMNRYNKNGVIVVDNLGLVEAADFLEPYTVSEHYNQAGRLAIATHVVEKAGKYLE